VVTATLEWLYRLTGQRQGYGNTEGRFDAVSFLAPYGFAARVVNERCPRSVVTVIIAEKRV
jgi:hypothetical protein